MPFPPELAKAQRDAIHEELIAHYRALADIRLNLQEPAHLFNLTRAQSDAISQLVLDAMESLSKAEKMAR